MSSINFSTRGHVISTTRIESTPDRTTEKSINIRALFDSSRVPCGTTTCHCQSSTLMKRTEEQRTATKDKYERKGRKNDAKGRKETSMRNKLVRTGRFNIYIVCMILICLFQCSRFSLYIACLTVRYLLERI